MLRRIQKCFEQIFIAFHEHETIPGIDIPYKVYTYTICVFEF